MSKFFSFLRFLIKTAILIILAVFLIVITQDIQIFPAAFKSQVLKILNQSPARDPEDTSARKFFVRTEDGIELEAWKFSKPNSKANKVAIIFHGNADPNLAIDPLSKWATNLDYTAYAFHYRGYGRSTGWPSEQGLYKDAKSVVDFIINQDKVLAKDLLFIGYSLGTPVAAKAASIYQPGILVLLAPFANIADVISAKTFYKYLVDFLWYEFPTEKFISEVNNSCLIIARAEQDALVPKGQTEKIIAAYQAKDRIKYLVSPTAEHGNVFFKLKDQLTKALLECGN